MVTRSLERIHEQQALFNAFTVVLDDSALAAARAADDLVRRGEDLLPLLGVPVSVKDHIWLTGAPATNGSVAYHDICRAPAHQVIGRRPRPAPNRPARR